MNPLYVNTHFAPDYSYGGVVESSSKIHKYVGRLLPFYCIAVSSDPNRVNKYLGNAGICYKSVLLHRFGFSLDLIFPLWRLIKYHDLIIINGIFTFPVTLAQIYSCILRKKFIVSIRGGLEPWRLNHKKLRKAIFNKLVTFPLLRRATFIHVTSVDEAKHVSALGFKNTKLISNGIDSELFVDFIPKSRKYFPDSVFVFLFLSRTDKEKGLDILLHAYEKFCNINNLKPNGAFALAIVGPDHQGYLSKLKIDYAKKNIIRIPGVYGAEKMQIIYESSCVILPSYSENFGNIIAEGMAMAKPVITTTGTPWSILKEKNLGYYVEPTENDILAAMQSVYHLSNEARELLGIRAKEFIIGDMSWSSKANDFSDLFKQALTTQS